MKRLIAVLFAALALSAGMAMAQDQYPSRPVKVIVPYAPGGATDIVARIVGDAFQKATGQPFIVINRPGAFGMLAIDEMVKAAPDGYTLMIGNVSTNAITPIIYANKMNFDYAQSVVAVTNLIDVPAFLLVSTLPVWSFKNFKVPHQYVLPMLLGAVTFAAVLVAEPWAALAAAGLIYLGMLPFSVRSFRRLRREAEDMREADRPG